MILKIRDWAEEVCAQSSIFLEGSKQRQDKATGCQLEALPLSLISLICDVVRGVSAWLINISVLWKTVSTSDPYGLGTHV